MQYRDSFRPFGTTLRIPMWQVLLFAGGVIAVAVALAIVFTGIFLIVAPVALLGWGIARLVRGAPAPAPEPAAWGGAPRIIDVEYEVLPPEPRHEKDRRR